MTATPCSAYVFAPVSQPSLMVRLRLPDVAFTLQDGDVFVGNKTSTVDCVMSLFTQKDFMSGLCAIDDWPSQKPGMGFEGFAENIAEIIRRCLNAPLTIGVFGGYGSGKTTLMKAISKRLEENADTKPICLWFHAWRYDQEPHLFLPFLAKLARDKRICPDETFSQSVTTAFRSFIYGLSLKFPIVDLSAKDALEREKELTEEAAPDIERFSSGFQDVPEALEKLTKKTDGSQRKIVVFIDDLDRCCPDRAFALLEALKAFTDIPGFIYVLGLDPRAIATYVTHKYGTDFVNPREYLEKIIQVSFSIPSPTTEQMRQMAGKLLVDLKEKLKEDPPWIKALEEAMKTGAQWMPANLRQAKRILNSYQLLHGLFLADGPEVDKPLLGLLIIQARWPNAFWVFQKYRKEFNTTIQAILAKRERQQMRVFVHNAAILEIRDDEAFEEVYSWTREDASPETISALLAVMGWPIDVEAEVKRQQQAKE